MSLTERARTSRGALVACLAIAVCLPSFAQEIAPPPAGGAENQPASVAASPSVTSVAAQKLGKIPPKYDVSKIGNRDIGSGINFYSYEKERALGMQLAQQVEQSARLITDPVVNEYVNRLGQLIVRNSDAKVPFVIKVLDDDSVNAFALPGGFFYVDSGLILATDNEAELAGVMAHEVAHVAARHATRQVSKSQLLNWVSIPLIFIGGPSGYAIQSVAALAIPLSYLRFSRGAEREADMLGVEYLYAAGYDPEAFVQFFEKLEAKQKKQPGFLAKTFSTHPMNAERVKSAQQEIAKYLPDRDQYVIDTSDFEQVKQRLAALTDSTRMTLKDGEARPTLRRRETTDSTESSSRGDEERPTLKRAPQAGGSTPDTTSPPDTTSTPTSTEDDRPVLRRAPQQ